MRTIKTLHWNSFRWRSKKKKKNAGDFESVLERFPFYSKTLEKDEK